MVRLLWLVLTTLLVGCEPGRPCTGDVPAPCDQQSCCGVSYTVCAVCMGEGSWAYPEDDNCHFYSCDDTGPRDTGTPSDAEVDGEAETVGDVEAGASDVAGDERG